MDDLEQKVKDILTDFFKSGAFSKRKITDTPTDALQVANKKYVDSHGGLPAGSNTQVQFNDNGAFGGDANLTWDKINRQFEIITVNDGRQTFKIQDDSTLHKLIIYINDSAGHGTVTIATNELGGTGDGSDLKLVAADSISTSGNGGSLIINSGAPGTSGAGGDIALNAQSGGSSAGNGGGISMSLGRGQASNGQAGDFIITKETGNGTGKNSHFILNNVGTAAIYRTFDEQLTTDATPTSITAADCPTLNNDQSVFIEARVCARRISGSGGSADDSASYIRRALYKKVGAAAPALVGSIQDGFTAEDQAAWDCTFVVSSNNILLQVTGAVNNTIDWTYEITYILR